MQRGLLPLSRAADRPTNEAAADSAAAAADPLLLAMADRVRRRRRRRLLSCFIFTLAVTRCEGGGCGRTGERARRALISILSQLD